MKKMIFASMMMCGLLAQAGGSDVGSGDINTYAGTLEGAAISVSVKNDTIVVVEGQKAPLTFSVIGQREDMVVGETKLNEGSRVQVLKGASLQQFCSLLKDAAFTAGFTSIPKACDATTKAALVWATLALGNNKIAVLLK